MTFLTKLWVTAILEAVWKAEETFYHTMKKINEMDLPWFLWKWRSSASCNLFKQNLSNSQKGSTRKSIFGITLYIIGIGTIVETWKKKELHVELNFIPCLLWNILECYNVKLEQDIFWSWPEKYFRKEKKY